MKYSRDNHIKFQNTLCYIFALALALAISFSGEISTIIIFIWSAFALFSYRWLYLFNKITYAQRIIILPIILYFITLIYALFFTSNIEMGTFKLEVKLSHLIFPFILLPAILFNKKQINHVLTLFVISSFISLATCFINAVLSYKVVGEGAFYYANFSIFFHTSYYALYLIFAVVASYYLIFQHKKSLIRIILIFAIFFFIAGIYFTSSKAGLLSVILTSVLIGFHHIFKKFSLFKLSIIIISLIGLAIIIFHNNRISYTTEQMSHKISVQKESSESTQFRFQSWHASLNLAKENLLFGVSPGDASDKLSEKYHELGYYKAENHNLNSHNQYLETLISLGLIGVLIIFGILFSPIAFKEFRQNYLLQFFIAIFAFNFIFESMLESRQGIIFFMFFYTFLIYTSKTINNDTVLTT